MRVIDYDNLPTKLPFWPTATAYLLLDRFQAAEWVWGVIGCLLAILWLGLIMRLCKQKNVDITSIMP